MEGSFVESVSLAKRLRALTDGQLGILERVDQACQELYLPEFEHYISHKYNPEIPNNLTRCRCLKGAFQMHSRQLRILMCGMVKGLMTAPNKSEKMLIPFNRPFW